MKPGPLDRLPTWARDLIVAEAAALSAWGLSDVVPMLQGKGGASALGAAALIVALNAVTKLTKAYGTGSQDPAPSGRRD